jgi:hypothetical protein
MVQMAKMAQIRQSGAAGRRIDARVRQQSLPL